ncbi:glycoside hydrolase, partial [Thozetella sp. PMI_491]
LHPCPKACGDLPPSNWTVYSSFDRFAQCAEPLLFDFAIYSSLSDPDTPSRINVCTEGGNADTQVNALFAGGEEGKLPLSTRAQLWSRDATAGTCGVSRVAETEASLEFSAEGPSLGMDETIAVAMDRLQAYNGDEVSCDTKTLFSYYRGVVVGLYVGKTIGRESIPSVFEAFQARSGNFGTTTVAQLCGSDRNANEVLGVVVSTDIDAVQDAIKGWDGAKCVSGLNMATKLENLSIWEVPIDLAITRNATASAANVEKVINGDTCEKLAARCGISGADFTKYNTDKDLCSTLMEGMRVCCSSGTLPDIRPKENADGTCFAYHVIADDNCAKIAAANGLKVDDILEFNDGKTWGWYNDCNKLQQDMYICLPPVPYPISNAVCGPTVPGTEQPPEGTELKDVNPCPLNVCCNKWGMCGPNDDFCLESPGPSPGTSTLQNGCISNCGYDIKNTDTAPASYGRVGYWESWNFDRDCLYQTVDHANTDGSYTIIHWAFAGINTADWTVKINDSYNQWDIFKKMSEKKVISFGGWGYSTEPETYDILRQGMSPSNRNTFAKNVAKFVADEGLDGVDFDWEYPGAEDIPGTPAGSPDDGINYLKFLTVMKSALPSGKTLSIAAPASYWYLKAFPIEMMAKTLDYIVYMTYDLHGQWDAGSTWSMEGCPSGNCLRSHVNITETRRSLSMITKAGVPTYKIFVGESSYGRSFKMSQAGCKGPMCTFTGDRNTSYAAPGMCTDTAGYISNAEILNQIQMGENIDSYYDFLSGSDILVYDDTEWVAYLLPETKRARRNGWEVQNFAGTIDWAVDLQDFTDDEYLNLNDPDFNLTDNNWPPSLVPCTGSYASLDDLEKAGDSVPEHCRGQYIVAIMKGIHEQSMKDYDTLIQGGYDKKFKTYADAVVSSGQSVIDDFMHDHGNDYFTCDVREEAPACDHCKYLNNPDKGQCRYCEDYDDGWDSVCEEPDVLTCGPYTTKYITVSGPCSPDFSLRAGPEPTDGYDNTVTWKFRSGKEDEFWAKLYSEAGIKQEDVKMTSRQRVDCAPNDKYCDERNHDHNYPIVDGYTRDDVLDPKKLVSSGYDKLKDLGPDMGTVAEMVQKEAFSGDSGDIVDAVSIPIFMVQDAVRQMTTIDDTVDKWNADKRKSIILAFLSAVFFFVPIVGEVIGAIAAFAGIARIIAILGTLGEIATDIYSMVDDKDNIPLGILSIVLAPLAIADAVQIGKAASKRAEMSPTQIKSLG